MRVNVKVDVKMNALPSVGSVVSRDMTHAITGRRGTLNQLLAIATTRGGSRCKIQWLPPYIHTVSNTLTMKRKPFWAHCPSTFSRSSTHLVHSYIHTKIIKSQSDFNLLMNMIKNFAVSLQKLIFLKLLVTFSGKVTFESFQSLATQPCWFSTCSSTNSYFRP